MWIQAGTKMQLKDQKEYPQHSALDVLQELIQVFLNTCFQFRIRVTIVKKYRKKLRHIPHFLSALLCMCCNLQRKLFRGSSNPL